MTIGKLYNAANVVVGQAAVLFAPVNTPLPVISATVPNMADPFDTTAFTSYHYIPGSGTSVIFTYKGVSGASLTLAGTTAVLVAANLNAIAGLSGVVVTSDGGTGFNISLSSAQLQSGVLTQVTTGGAGSSMPGPLWVACGATDQGWKYEANKSTTSIMVEEQSTPVATTVTSQKISIAGSMAEDIAPTLALARNAINTLNAAATTNPAYNSLILTDAPILYAVCLVTMNSLGFPRWEYAPAWTQLTNTSTDFRRASTKRMYPVLFETVCPTNQIQTLDFVAVHS